MKKVLIISITVLLIIIGVMGFQKYNEKKNKADEIAKLQYNIDHIDEYMESDEYKNDHPDMSSYLKVSNLQSTFSTGLYNMSGQITNTSTEYVDSIGELAIFDKVKNLITIKHLDLTLQPNESVYFDETVGTDIAGYYVKLQNFDN